MKFSTFHLYLAFIAGALLAVGVGCMLNPWRDGYCVAACGDAKVVQVLSSFCLCGPSTAPTVVTVPDSS